MAATPIRANRAELGSNIKLDQKASKKVNSPAALKNLNLKSYICIRGPIVWQLYFQYFAWIQYNHSIKSTISLDYFVNQQMAAVSSMSVESRSSRYTNYTK